MPIGTPNLPLELRTIDVKLDDLIAIGRFEDHPGQLAFLCEKEDGGIRKRRAIFFPNDPQLVADLAQVLMEFGGIQAISISKKRGAHITFGPQSAKLMFDRVVKQKSDLNKKENAAKKRIKKKVQKAGTKKV